MTEPHPVGYWFAIIGLCVAIPLLSLRVPAVRRAVGRWIVRQGSRAVDWLRPVPEVDEFAADLYRISRIERLRGDIQRLQRILATDVTMSATRQLGNRLAYEWLLRELKTTRSLLQPVATAGNWDDIGVPSPTVDLGSGRDLRPASGAVESIDIGWRR